MADGGWLMAEATADEQGFKLNSSRANRACQGAQVRFNGAVIYD
jgi:hypothetical protein